MSGRSHFLDEEQALEQYFRQMLSSAPDDDSSEDQENKAPEDHLPCPQDQPSVTVSQSAAPEADLAASKTPDPAKAASSDYYGTGIIDAQSSDESFEMRPQPETQKAVAPEVLPLESAPSQSLEKLLEKVDESTQGKTVTQTAVEVKTQTGARTEEKTAVSAPETVTELKTDTKTQSVTEHATKTVTVSEAESAADQAMIAAAQAQEAQAAPQASVVTATVSQSKTETKTAEQVVDKTEQALSPVAPPEHPDDPLEWKNIDLPEEFQALFFLVKGVRFAVPLIELGGIFETPKLTRLFGKPVWYKGMADIRGRKINVVDTLRWVKPDVTFESDYSYLILLGMSLWSIGCDTLEGNRIVRRESVNWRTQAGSRPWLAGIVKKEMCALIHVKALIAMFERGMGLLPKDMAVNDAENGDGRTDL